MNRRVDSIIDDLKMYLEQARAAGIERVYVDAQRVVESRKALESAMRTAAGSSPAAERGDTAAADALARPPLVRDDAQRRTEKQQALQAMDEAEVRGCVRCPLSKTRTQTVFGVGNPDADLVFVGEAPGRDEDLQGEPFVGAAGQLLTRILGAIGFRREDVYICNVLKCRPPNNRDPQPIEVASCEPYLLRQLKILDPKLICALGRHAAHTLLSTGDSLKRMREKVHDYHGIPTVVTYHPAALLRNPQWKRPTWEDVQKLRALYDRLVSRP